MDSCIEREKLRRIYTQHTTHNTIIQSQSIRDHLLMEMQDEFVMQVESVLNEISSAILEAYGFEPYPWQCAVFMKCLSMQQDIIVSAATSDGTSLCYQGMAFCHSKAIVMVISPTKALMDDQVCDPKHQSC